MCAIRKVDPEWGLKVKNMSDFRVTGTGAGFQRGRFEKGLFYYSLYRIKNHKNFFCTNSTNKKKGKWT